MSNQYSNWTPEQRVAAFWSKVNVKDALECWPWTAGVFKNPKAKIPYGAVQWNGRATQAHRVAFFLSNGYLPEGKCVLHSCDNPLCCNPVHLFAGTKTENMEDKVAKGRQAKGAGHGRAKLTNQQVADLRIDRKKGMTIVDLGKKYGITHVAARRVALKITYKEV